ncbi:MAG: hypothetical protein M1827_002644 [Pycnora praestabilis]|nr:MAG: hypothetical protein M1827_002644 [Pycnora praestabilis]
MAPLAAGPPPQQLHVGGNFNDYTGPILAFEDDESRSALQGSDRPPPPQQQQQRPTSRSQRRSNTAQVAQGGRQSGPASPRPARRSRVQTRPVPEAVAPRAKRAVMKDSRALTIQDALARSNADHMVKKAAREAAPSIADVGASPLSLNIPFTAVPEMDIPYALPAAGILSDPALRLTGGNEFDPSVVLSLPQRSQPVTDLMLPSSVMTDASLLDECLWGEFFQQDLDEYRGGRLGDAQWLRLQA